MRRFLTAMFIALTLSEIIVSPFVCRLCCPSSEEDGQSTDVCSPWCASCTCCHQAQTVCPEVPPVLLIPQAILGARREPVPDILISPPRDVLHVPLVSTTLG